MNLHDFLILTWGFIFGVMAGITIERRAKRIR